MRRVHSQVPAAAPDASCSISFTTHASPMASQAFEGSEVGRKRRLQHSQPRPLPAMGNLRADNRSDQVLKFPHCLLSTVSRSL